MMRGWTYPDMLLACQNRSWRTFGLSPDRVPTTTTDLEGQTMKRLLTIAAAVAAIAVAPTTAHAQSATPSISLIHGIPGTTVDLVVDGTVVLDAFAPGSIVDITSFAGRTLNNVEVVADDTGDTVIGPVATLDVPATGNWSLIAHLNASGVPTLSSFENNLADLSTGEARLTVRHVADAGPVGVEAGEQRCPGR